MDPLVRGCVCHTSPLLLLQQIQFVGRRGGVVHLAERRQGLRRTAGPRDPCRLLDVREEERLWEHEHVVSAEIRVGLFAGNQQQVAVGEALAAFEIDLLLIQPQLAGVVRMRVASGSRRGSRC